MFKMGKLLKGQIFSQRPNFSAKLAGKVCQELATLVVHCVYSGGGGHTYQTGSVCQQYTFYAKKV